jgi:hypothetical protein
LDYQTETTNVIRRTEQKHMVDWIISSVRYFFFLSGPPLGFSRQARD